MKRRELTNICVFFLLFVFSCFAQDQGLVTEAKADVQTLELGQTVDREISPAQKHFYKVHLEAGQFLRIEAQQVVGDVRLMVFALDNKNTHDMKNEAPVGQIEYAVAAVKVPGDYQIRVSIDDKGKIAGKYSLKIAEIRTATEKELAYSEGRKIMSEIEIQYKADYSAENARAFIDRYLHAIDLFRTAGVVKFEAVSLSCIGVLYSRLGNTTKSLEFHLHALEKFRAIADKKQQAHTLNDIGRQYAALGNRQKGIEMLTDAFSIAEEAKDKKLAATALNGIGAIYLRLNDPEKAESYHAKAMKIFEEIEDKYNQTITLNYLGNAASNQKSYQRGVEYYLKAIEIEKSLTGRQPNPSYLNNLGMAYFNLGEHGKAIEYIEKALAISRKRNDKPDEADFLQKLGKANYALKKYEAAVDFQRQSLQIYRSIEEPTRMAETLFSLSRAQSQIGDLIEAQANIEEGIRLMEDFRVYAATNEMRDLYSANSHRYFGFYIELLMRHHALEPNKSFDVLALQASERSRARGLLNLLAESNIDIREGVDPKLLERENESKKLLTSRIKQLTEADKSKPEQIEMLKRAVEAARTDHQRTQAQIRNASPRYAALTQPTTLSLKEIQTNVLDADSVLLEYALGETKSYLWIITKTGFRSVELPAKDAIDKTARQFYESLTARNKRVKFETPEERDARIVQADSDLDKFSGELSRMILAPAAPFLANKLLLIVADGALQYVPFAALSTKNGFLVQTNEVVSLPSASVLAILRSETSGRQPASKTLAVLADPVFDKKDERFQTIANKGKREQKLENSIESVALTKKRTRTAGDPEGELDLARLPFTRREADLISSVIPEDQKAKWLDFAANRRSAISPQLSNYRFVHFATHGFINDQNPELSGLVFSTIDEDGKEQDGFLRVGDIFSLKLPAEMIVLSGCQTGLGKEIKGEGLVGMSRAFMYAGAKRLMVSLWDINDEATSELMSHLYREMFGSKKRSPAAALRQAQNAMIKDKRWNNPYFWSTFVLQGEPK